MGESVATVPVVPARADRRVWLALLALLGLAVLLLVPQLAAWLGKPYLVGVFTRFAIYALAAVSLDLAMGYGGMVSFGHAMFFAVGGYAVGIIASHVAEAAPLLGWDGSSSALVVWPAAVLAASLLGLLVGYLSLRTTGVQFIMITLAFAQLVFLILQSLEPYGGDDGLLISRRTEWPGLGRPSDAAFYYICLGGLALWVGLLHRLVRSRFGLVLRALRQSERRVANLGYPARPYRLVAFTISAAGMGLAGAMWADYGRFVSPDMGAWTKSGEFMAMAILGGVGTLIGPVLGASVFLGLEQLLTGLTERWLIVFGPLLVLAVLFARRGLIGLLVR